MLNLLPVKNTLFYLIIPYFRCLGNLGAKLRFCEEFTIFDTESAEEPQTRMIAGIEKIGETEKIYPRNFSQIKKKPL